MKYHDKIKTVRRPRHRPATALIAWTSVAAAITLVTLFVWAMVAAITNAG